MCGRFTMAVSEATLRDFLKEQYNILDFKSVMNLPNYNIAPGTNIICIISDGKEYRAGEIEWGFTSSFSPDGKTFINARSETAMSKPTFKESFYSRRCVIVADGFYEWSKNDNSKEPMRIQLQNKELFGFAGLWTKEVVDGGTHYSCTILTTSANDLIKEIHHRMPVILNEEDAKLWLDPSVRDRDLLSSVLKKYPSRDMIYYPVSEIVNNPINNNAECIKERNA